MSGLWDLNINLILLSIAGLLQTCLHKESSTERTCVRERFRFLMAAKGEKKKKKKDMYAIPANGLRNLIPGERRTLALFAVEK